MRDTKDNISEENLRTMVREILANEEDIREFDALYSKPKQWKDSAKELRANLTSLLKNIENDEYKEGESKIDDVISQLQSWKVKINKFI